MPIHPKSRAPARVPACLPDRHNALAAACLLFLALAGCGRDDGARAPAADGRGKAPATATAPAAAVTVEDVIETDPRYVIGISYPRGINQFPGLAVALKAYADAARAEVLSAVEGADAGTLKSPYDLSLVFSTLVATPRLVAVAADGSAYTGGAHGNPLVARFVWLPAQQRMLTAEELVDAGGWEAISSHVREQLHAAVSQRVDADDLAPAEREQVMRTAMKMIEEGSEADPANFAQFEPVPGPDGRLRALRFVFPPYQVGPYSDGVQTVEVPAAVLLPHITAPYRELFSAV